MSDTVYLPEINRKKKTWDRYEPSSFRVMGDEAMNLAPFYPYNDFRGPLKPGRRPANDLEMPHNIPQTSVLPFTTPDFRVHNPHPFRISVIGGNVKSLLEPICDVRTDDTFHEKEKWWPRAPPKAELVKPPYTINTTYRGSYLQEKEKDRTLSGATRHSANPNRTAAHGAIPISNVQPEDEDPRFFYEKKSYEMIYDARKDPNYPIRGKRLGAFVWEPVSPQRAKNFLEYRAWLNQQKPPSSRKERKTSIGHREGWMPVKEKIGVKDKIPKGYAVYAANKPAEVPYYMRGPPESLTECLVNADIETFSKPEAAAQPSLGPPPKPAEQTEQPKQSMPDIPECKDQQSNAADN